MSCIEKHFQGSKNLFNAKWDVAEKLIAAGLEKIGFKILKKNYITPFGEVDLLVSYRNQHFMIEIKAVSEIAMLDRITRSGQKQRLVKIYKYLENDMALRAMLIVIERKNKEVIVYLDYL